MLQLQQQSQLVQQQAEHSSGDGLGLQSQLLHAEVLHQVGLLVVVRVRRSPPLVLEEAHRGKSILIEGLLIRAARGGEHCGQSGYIRVHQIHGVLCESGVHGAVHEGLLDAKLGGGVANRRGEARGRTAQQTQQHNTHVYTHGGKRKKEREQRDRQTETDRQAEDM